MPSLVFAFGALLHIGGFDGVNEKRERVRPQVERGLLMWKNRLGRLA